MTRKNNTSSDPNQNSENSIVNKKSRTSKPKKPDAELIALFWLSPSEAFFGQETVAPVTGKAIKTLECDRWRKSGISFRKVGGRVLYQKKHVVSWLESHALVSSTSESSKERSA